MNKIERASRKACSYFLKKNRKITDLVFIDFEEVDN